MALPRISPSDAKLLVDNGALLVDIREIEEHLRESIPGAKSQPLALLRDTEIVTSAPSIVFHCKSGNRTLMNSGLLAKAAGGVDGFIVEGGIEAWKAAGLPIRKNRSRPIELPRQVQIAAGVMTVAATLLGYFVNPGFYALSACVGLALVVNGITGGSTANRVMRIMPWNRVQAS